MHYPTHNPVAKIHLNMVVQQWQTLFFFLWRMRQIFITLHSIGMLIKALCGRNAELNLLCFCIYWKPILEFKRTKNCITNKNDTAYSFLTLSGNVLHRPGKVFLWFCYRGSFYVVTHGVRFKQWFLIQCKSFTCYSTGVEKHTECVCS